MRTPNDNEFLLNAQRGLLGEIPPRLRAVSFDLSEDGMDLVARFEFDGEPTEEERECAGVAMTNIVAGYSKRLKSCKEEVVPIPYPAKLKLLRLVAFLRNEDAWNSWSKTFNTPMDAAASRLSS
jgi:hypothetical protein